MGFIWWIYVSSEGYLWWQKVINLAQRLLDSHANTIMDGLDIIERDISFQKVLIIITMLMSKSDVRSGRAYSSLASKTLAAGATRSVSFTTSMNNGMAPNLASVPPTLKGLHSVKSCEMDETFHLSIYH